MFCGLILFSVATSTAQSPLQADLATVLQRAGVYVTHFYEQLSGIVAEETYTQKWARIMRRSWRGLDDSQQPEQGLQERHLRSDLALVHPANSTEWLQFRDVFDVNGTPVRDRAERLTKLFLEPAYDGDDQLGRIKEESARYNLGDIVRNLNTPVWALQILRPDRQARFRFKRTSQREIATKDIAPDAAGVFHTSVEVWVIEYEEVVHPTLIRTGKPVPNKDLPARGRFWIAPSTGRVLMTELHAGDRHVSGTIDVSYQSEPPLGSLVPVEMREDYRDDGGSHVTGVATYGRFRQFQVNIDEKFLIKK